MIGNAVSILILEWERHSHTLLSCCGNAVPIHSHTCHCLVVIGVTSYVTVVTRHQYFWRERLAMQKDYTTCRTLFQPNILKRHQPRLICTSMMLAFLLIFGRLLYRPPFIDEGQIWCARETQGLHLQVKISSECVHCVGFRWPKTTILGKFWHFGGSWTDPLSPITAKFGMLEQTQGLHSQAKFHLNVFIVSASGGQNHNFWQIVTFWGLLYRPLLPMKAEFGVL